MMRFLALASVVLLALRAIAADELPKPDDGGEALDIEPPLLIQNGVPLAALAENPAPIGTADPEHIQLLLDHARQSAATGERLCRAGIIAKVQAEERVLKAVRLEADIASAQLQRAKDEHATRQQRFDAREIQKSELDESAAGVADATQAAQSVAAKRNRAEHDFAEANLHRQEKLLALGSARKADVDRAAEKLAALARTND